MIQSHHAHRHAELVSAGIVPRGQKYDRSGKVEPRRILVWDIGARLLLDRASECAAKWMLKQVQHDGSVVPAHVGLSPVRASFEGSGI